MGSDLTEGSSAEGWTTIEESKASPDDIGKAIADLRLKWGKRHEYRAEPGVSNDGTPIFKVQLRHL